MKKAKLLLMRLLFPPKAVLIILPVISFSVLIYIFAADMVYGAVAYAVYGFSAYSLTIIATAAVRYGADVRSAVKNNSLVKAVMSHPAVRRYRNDILLFGGFGAFSQNNDRHHGRLCLRYCHNYRADNAHKV